MKKIVKMVVIILCLGWVLTFIGCKGPIVRDKYGMVRSIPWKSFTISQSSDDYSQHYSYTVEKDQENYYLVIEGEYPDFEDRRILLPGETVEVLLDMDLGCFPDETPEVGSDMILDGTFQSLIVIDESGILMKKSVSFEEAQKLRELLEVHLADAG